MAAVPVQQQPPSETVPTDPTPPAESVFAQPQAATAPSVAAFAPATSLRPAPLPPLPPVRSADGRLLLTDTTLSVRGEEFLLRDLERAELTPVRWILWYLLGGLSLAAVMIAFLSNWLRTMTAAAGMVASALLLLYGRRGTNRLRLQRSGRQAVNFALPGETAEWQRLTGEINRRIRRIHDHAAAEAAALLAEADAAMRAAAEAAQAAQANTAFEHGSPNEQP